MPRHRDAVDAAARVHASRESSFATPSFRAGIVHNVQDEMDGKLELRVMDDELVSTPDFLGYAQLEHKELLYKMPGQGWRNLDLVDDPAGAYLGVLRSFSEIMRHLHEVASIRRGRDSIRITQVWSGGRRRKIIKCSPRCTCEVL